MTLVLVGLEGNFSYEDIVRETALVHVDVVVLYDNVSE